MKNLFTVLLLVTITTTFIACQKTNTPSEIGKGKFTENGTTHSGICAKAIPAQSGIAGNYDVVITEGSAANFVIYNMPTQSSGTYNILTDAISSNTYVYCNIGTTALVMSSTNGSIKKTSEGKFTCNVTMQDIATSKIVEVTAEGSY